MSAADNPVGVDKIGTETQLNHWPAPSPNRALPARAAGGGQARPETAGLGRFRRQLGMNASDEA
jgi:hypothetical protein